MKKAIDVFSYANDILKALQTGVLLTTKADNKINSMTISWGTLGRKWEKPIFTVFIRENRFTRQLIEKNPEFTINIPYGSFDKKILGICGTKSGKDLDKIQAAGLTIEEPEVINVPGFKELPLTLECKVVYKRLQAAEAITAENRQAFYPQDVDGSFHGANRDYHVVYYGEIVSAYLIE